MVMARPAWQREGDQMIDERFMDEWLEFGWSELISYLTKWARFLELYPEQEEQNEH